MADIKCRTPSTNTNNQSTSTTSKSARPPTAHAPLAVNPYRPNMATNSTHSEPIGTPESAPTSRPKRQQCNARQRRLPHLYSLRLSGIRKSIPYPRWTVPQRPTTPAGGHNRDPANGQNHSVKTKHHPPERPAKPHTIRVIKSVMNNRILGQAITKAKQELKTVRT